MGTLVVKREDFVFGADDDELRAGVLDLNRCIRAKARQREFKILHTSCAAFQVRLRKGSGTEAH